MTEIQIGKNNIVTFDVKLLKIKVLFDKNQRFINYISHKIRQIISSALLLESEGIGKCIDCTIV